MPFLQWVNDNEARRAAKAVPFRLLKEEAVYGDARQAKDNILLQGDNLDALRALLPFYRGKVKCIYIDPPYNTGSAFAHYDDNLEHSQWLSMMMPRLQVLREFMSEEGSIWVSIDDDEQAYLKVLLDEVFGRQNFICSVIWEKKYTVANDAKYLSDNHDFILVYAKNKTTWTCNRLPRTEEMNSAYKNPDNHPKGPWKSTPLHAKSGSDSSSSKNFSYTFKNGVTFIPPAGTFSRFSTETLQMLDENDEIYFGKDGSATPSRKTFLSELKKSGVCSKTLWRFEDVGHNHEAREEVKAFNATNVFDTPKPERLIQKVLILATNPGDLVLDSFLGSGTTAAVAHKMGRRYIGIEMGEHTKTHCIPRLQKVIDGEQGGISKAVNWHGGGGFTFYTLDEPVFDELGLINPKVDFKTLAAYLWQRETKEPSVPEYSPYLGSHQGTAYYLLFNGVLSEDNLVEPNVLTYSVLKSLLEDYPFNGPKVIYADACAGISDHELKKLQVTFKQIPYDIMQ